MEVYVIRHTPVAVGQDICYGQSEVPLTDTFLLDAEQYKNQLPHDFDVTYCSPTKRCKDLSIALGYSSVSYESALLEMHFGDWENKKWNDIQGEELNRWMIDFVNMRTPHGENLLDLYERVKNFLDNLRTKEHKKVLIITHAGVIRCIWAYLLNIPLQNIFKIPVGYHEIFQFNLTADVCMDSIKRMK